VADLGVWMFNVHAAGGSQMMTAAREAIDKYNHRPKLIAVTILTSLQQPDLEAIGLQGTPEQAVLRFAQLAQSAHLDGVVCSPQEITTLRATMPADFALVTPGVRPANSAKDDQKRTLTPNDAIQAGSNYLVIGRPITASADPIQALHDIQTELGI
jgi:orotidine-5'-phosphate decarboxylase